VQTVKIEPSSICYGAAVRAVSSLRYIKFIRIISAKRKNILRYVKFSRMFLQNVKCLRYDTLRIDTYGSKSTLRYGFLRYVTLREGGKHA